MSLNIVVCIKQVPDTTEIKLDPVKGTLIREGVPSIMNPDDKGGLEMAIQLKEKYGAHITVITMGPMQADDILREAYAMGADDAIHLSDRKFGGADTLATSTALAGAIRTLDYDIVITGRQAIDGDTAQVGPQVAEHLGIPQVTYVQSIDVDKEGKVTVRKSTEEGYQILELQTPCMIAALTNPGYNHYMTVRGIIEAYEREVNLWGADKIDVDETRLGLKGSPTRVIKSFTKGVKPSGQIVEATTEEAVDIIIEKLKDKYII